MARSEIFRKISETLRANFDRIKASIPHSGEKGYELENTLIEFLNNHLPKRFSASSGFIIDRNDNVSTQQDIVIYDALNTPLYSVDSRNRIVPNDNVAITIEVKANLQKQDIIDSAKKIEKIKSLVKVLDLNTPSPGVHYSTLSFIFAYTSRLSLDKIREIYVSEAKKRITDGRQIDGIFILDKGFISLAIRLTNGEFGPIYIMKSAANEPGAVISVCSQNFEKETLDYFIRMMLPHLSMFYHRVDHPGFRWVTEPQESKLYSVPIDFKNIDPNPPCYCTSSRKYKDCHQRINQKLDLKMMSVGRNNPCPCGSGKKFKRCHGA